MGDPQTIQPGCYYPGCENETDHRDKFCPAHHGRSAAHSKTLDDGTIVVRRRGEEAWRAIDDDRCPRRDAAGWRCSRPRMHMGFCR